jgi:hypothetical protein
VNTKELSIEEVGAWEGEVYTPEQIAAIREAESSLVKNFGWIYAECEKVREVSITAGFRRSLAGSRQNEWLLRLIYCAHEHYKDEPNLARTKIFEAARDYFSPTGIREGCSELNQFPHGHLFDATKRLHDFLDRRSPSPRSTIEFFEAIADCLEYIESFRPALRDFAIETLQNAFVGLMQSKCGWETKGLPTKGEVIAMAKAHLERHQYEVPRSGWTGMLKDGGLDFLPAGKAGRPSKAEVDENLKAKQEVLSIITRMVNERDNGDWNAMLSRVKPSCGAKKAVLQSEQARLDSQRWDPQTADKEDETE